MSVYKYSLIALYIDSTVDNNYLVLSHPNPNTFEPGSKIGPSSARVCPKGPGPHSAAKQHRSLCVPVLKHPGTLCAQGVGGAHSAAKQRRSLCVPALNRQDLATGLLRSGKLDLNFAGQILFRKRGILIRPGAHVEVPAPFCVCEIVAALEPPVVPKPGARIKKMDSGALSCASKRAGATVCSKTARRSLCVPAPNHPGLCAQGVRATFCMYWLLSSILPKREVESLLFGTLKNLSFLQKLWVASRGG